MFVSGIRAAHDDDIAPIFAQCLAGVDSGLDAIKRFVAGDDSLAGRVATTLGGQLIFNHDGGASCLGKSCDGTAHIHGIAISGVAITYQRDVNHIRDIAR